MNMIISCPICRKPASYEWYSENMELCESYLVCSHCGFSKEFAYGSYRMYVHGKEFIWWYKTPHDSPIFKRIKRAKFMARRNWKKFKKAYK